MTIKNYDRVKEIKNIMVDKQDKFRSHKRSDK